MKSEQPAYLTTDLNRKVRSLSLDKENLRKLLNILQERCFAAGELEVANYQQLNQTKEAFEANKLTLKQGFQFYITIAGTDGRQLNGSTDGIFDSPNFPHDVASIFFDSASPLKIQHNYTPRNSVVLYLDFTRPAVFNFTLLPSQETPNGSNISVRGSDPTWVNGVFREFEGFLHENPSSLSMLHRHSIYDILV
jgi:hypothetical protein